MGHWVTFISFPADPGGYISVLLCLVIIEWINGGREGGRGARKEGGRDGSISLGKHEDFRLLSPSPQGWG